MRFLLETDYAMQIKNEIIRLLTAPTDWYISAKLVRAEQTAIAQIRNRIGKRYDCSLIFSPPVEGQGEARDQWVVTVTIDIALYHLYSQTGMKDIPEHRQQRYQDALDWLKDVGNGNTPADLPEIIEENGETYSEFRLNSRTPQNWKW
jgi:phage gp36-like protein